MPPHIDSVVAVLHYCSPQPHTHPLPRRSHLPGWPQAKRRKERFTAAQRKILTDWFDNHNNHPYPTKDEKRGLCDDTHLTPEQVAQWCVSAMAHAPTTKAMRAT